MHEDDPTDMVHDQFAQVVFGDSRLGRPVLGTVESIETIGRSAIAGYYRRRYRPQDMVVAVAGNVDHAAVVRLVKKAFDGPGLLDGTSPPTAPRAGERNPRTESGVRVVRRTTEQANVVLGGVGVSRTDERRFALGVLNAALGGGMSSRLFQEVRENRGLCYTISAFHAPYSDTGMFGIYAGTDSSDVQELMRVVVDETAAASGNITEAEVNRAKAQIKVGLLMALESSGARARQLAGQILTYGRVLPIEEMVARVDGVTVESTRAAGASLLARARPAIAALGPSKGLEGAANIVESLKRRAA